MLAAVKGAEHHPDAKWVYEKVSQEIPNVSLGTVYRALASLSAEGLIREYRQADGPSLYDPNTEEHFHIRCTSCGRIEDVPPVKLPDEMLETVRKRARLSGSTSAAGVSRHLLRVRGGSRHESPANEGEQRAIKTTVQYRRKE